MPKLFLRRSLISLGVLLVLCPCGEALAKKKKKKVVDDEFTATPPPVATYRRAPAASAAPASPDPEYVPTIETMEKSSVGPAAVENANWWSPEKQHHSVGFEGTAGVSVLPKNAVLFGWWLTEDIGIDAYLGYTKAADNASTTTASADDGVANSRTITTTSGGVRNPHTFLFGGGVRYKVYQNSWFQFTLGAIAAIVPGNSTEWSTGSSVQTIGSLSTPGSYTMTETGLGTRKSENSILFNIGPKLGTEFYLKWIPHLAIGFSTGILASFGGTNTTTTTARTRTFAVNNGTPQTPTTDTSTTTVATTTLGPQGLTFGVGGTQFNLIGNFTIRYIW